MQMQKLTRREVQVLHHLAHGLFNKEIGQKLGISEQTVKNHISMVMQKLKVRNRVEAAMFYWGQPRHSRWRRLRWWLGALWTR